MKSPEATQEELYFAGIKALALEIGRDAQIHTSIDYNLWRDSKAPPVEAKIYPNGILGGSPVVIQARSIDGLADKLRQQWNAHAAQHREARIAELAAAIIFLTGTTGNCTDSQLRMRGFSQREVEDLGTDACVKAEAMAASGPFLIQKIAALVNAA